MRLKTSSGYDSMVIYFYTKPTFYWSNWISKCMDTLQNGENGVWLSRNVGCEPKCNTVLPPIHNKLYSLRPTLIMDRREYQFLLCPALLYAKTYTEGGNIGKCGLHFQWKHIFPITFLKVKRLKYPDENDYVLLPLSHFISCITQIPRKFKSHANLQIC